LNTIRRKHGCSFDNSGRLTDEQVAAVLTYIRNSWGNAAATASAEEVKFIKRKLTANGGLHGRVVVNSKIQKASRHGNAAHSIPEQKIFHENVRTSRAGAADWSQAHLWRSKTRCEPAAL
jgi:hypothetical protein